MKKVKSLDVPKKRHLIDTEAQISSQDEVLQLQKQLKNQVMTRYAMEKALSSKNISHDFMRESMISEHSKNLIKEIAVLELEVKNLETYLLTMYRKIYRKSTNSVSGTSIFREVSEPDISSKKANISHSVQPRDSSNIAVAESANILVAEKLINSGVRRCESSLSQCSASALGASPTMGALAEAVYANQSLPLSLLERAPGTGSNPTLAEHLGNKIYNRVEESPNMLSEKMIKCISAIYSQLADPPLFNRGFFSSPISLSSSISDPSSPAQHDILGGESSHFDSWSNHHFNVNLSDEIEPEGPFLTSNKVLGIRRDSQSVQQVEHMLENFRSLVSRLEKVDIKKLKHEEKLAFWINVHNTLVMHTLLVYGIPQSNLKRISLILKAAYDIGGYTITLNVIRSSIFGCWLPRPGQWFQSLFFPRTKYKTGGNLKAYAIERPEPRIYFALSSGSHSDPILRLYTAKTVFQELEVAKEEYIQTNIKLHKEHKLILPKIVELFMKETGLSPLGLREMIEDYLPDSLRLKIQQSERGKIWKKIVWTPHNFSFGFQLSNELSPC